MNRIIESHKKFSSKEYGSGLLKSVEIMIAYCEKEVSDIKSDNAQPNTPRQITNGGKLKAFYKMLNILKARKEYTIKKLNNGK